MSQICVGQTAVPAHLAHGDTCAPTRYADADGDGYGNASVSLIGCNQPAGYVSDPTDCDDTRTGVHPGATEVCDAADTDEDCDGAADDADPSATGQTDWYLDADGDGYGDALAPTLACDQPAGFVADATDCDDTDASVHPSAAEVCDGSNADEDCDGLADDGDSAAGQATWYADADGDGFGDADAPTDACDAPAGFVADATDCDDADSGIHPDAAEVCDAADADEDCDGAADDADPSATGQTTSYADADGDGFGDPVATLTACDPPPGYVADATDCGDADAGINPTAAEACNGLDDDCDGVVDNGCSICVPESPVAIATGQNRPWRIALDAAHVYWTNHGSCDFCAVGSVMELAKSGGTPITLASGLQKPWGLGSDEAFVYFGEQDTGRVYKVPVGGGALTTLAVPPRPGNYGFGIDATHVYWANDGGVNRVAKAGGSISVLGNVNGFNLALDDSFVYVAGGIAGAPPDGIYRVPLAGGVPVRLSEQASAAGIFVLGDDVYWVSMANGDISRVPTAGGTATVVASDGASGVQGLATDGLYIYYTNVLQGTVKAFPVEGGDILTIASGQGMSEHANGLAVDECSVYWANGAAGTVMRASKPGL